MRCKKKIYKIKYVLYSKAFSGSEMPFFYLWDSIASGYISKSIIDISNKQFPSQSICDILISERKGGGALRVLVSRPMLERLPVYASCLEKMINDGVSSVSAVRVARELKLGEVQVRKELAVVSGAGRPRIGYDAKKLLHDIKCFLGEDEPDEAVIVGAGRLGCALLGYGSFEDVGVTIKAAFDISGAEISVDDKNIYPMSKLHTYCKQNWVKIGIITVPASAAQETCELLVSEGIRAIWNFAPTTLHVPDGVTVINEKLAISLSQLRQHIN